jgi:hypothetical protein
MLFGHSLLTDTIANMFDRNGERTGDPLRPRRRTNGTRSRRAGRGADSFANHPERW